MLEFLRSEVSPPLAVASCARPMGRKALLALASTGWVSLFGCGNDLSRSEPDTGDTPAVDSGVAGAGGQGQSVDPCQGLRVLDEWTIDRNQSLHETAVKAACVEEIAGSLVVFETGLTSLSFPRLRTVGSISVRRNQSLSDFAVPALQWTERGSGSSGTIELSNNPALSAVHFDNLRCLPREACDADSAPTDPRYEATALRVIDNHALQSIRFDSLEATSGFEFAGGRSLTEFSAPKLQVVMGSLVPEAGDVFLTGVGFSKCPALTDIDMPKLEEVRFGGVSLFQNQALEQLSLPMLASARALWIYSNQKLTAVSLPELVSLQAMQFTDNSQLSSCTIAALEFQTGVACEPLDAFSGSECVGNLVEPCP